MGVLKRGRVAAIGLACVVSALGCRVPRIAERTDPCVGSECLRPDVTCAYDSADCNPAVADVAEQVRTLRDHGGTLGFHLRAMPAPSRWNHWQSIQRMAGSSSNVLLATRSTPRPADADLAVIELGSRSTDGGALGANRDGEAPPASDQVIAAMASATSYTHAGGTQLLGKLLAVPLERDVRGSQVELVDLQTPSHPVSVGAIQHTVADGTSGEAGTASMARLADGHFLLAIGRRDARILDFYRSTTTSVHATEWKLWDTWHVDELTTAIGEDDYGDYQNLNLIAGTDGRLFLLGLHEDGILRRSQWIDLFEIGGGREVTLTKVAKRRLQCASGCNLDAGGGSYIDARGRLIVYGIEYTNSGPGASVRVVEFEPGA
ncbi:MAG: hypothetical protein JWP01_4131 [Myxococcales bacterium]|nr:hypothetical protein [Myxococcales bacterium]